MVYVTKKTKLAMFWPSNNDSHQQVHHLLLLGFSRDSWTNILIAHQVEFLAHAGNAGCTHVCSIH